MLYLGGYGDLFKTDGAYPYGQYAKVPLRGLGGCGCGGCGCAGCGSLGQVTTPWYTRTWVWAVAGGAALLVGAGSYMALRKNRRRVRRNRRRVRR